MDRPTWTWWIATLSLVATLSAPGPVLAQASPSPAPPFVVLADTTSPDGRHALAWGRRRGGGPGIENFLVDLGTRTIVATLPGFHYWCEVDDDQFRYLSVAWGPSSRFAVAMFHGRWQTLALVLISVDPRGVPDLVDLLEPVQTSARAWLVENRPTDDARVKGGWVTIVPRLPEFRRGGQLAITVTTMVPRKEVLMDGCLKLRFGLDTGRRLRIHVGRLTASPCQ